MKSPSLEEREIPKLYCGSGMRERTQSLPKAPKWPWSAVKFRKKAQYVPSPALPFFTVASWLETLWIL